MDRRTLLKKASAAFAFLTGGEKLSWQYKGETPHLVHKSRMSLPGYPREDKWDVEIPVPSSLNDPMWHQLGIGDEDILALATQSHILRVQMRIRKMVRDLESDLDHDEIQDKIDEVVKNYKHYRVSTKPAPPVLNAADIKFTEAQIAALKAAGVRVK